MSERDTHFQNFAEMEFHDLIPHLNDYFRALRTNDVLDRHRIQENMKRVLAQHAYDLVSHTILNIDPYHLDALPFEEIPARIPDMTEWPEKSDVR